MAQQGSPPRRYPRQAGPGHRARPERPERIRRDRPEPHWQRFDAFAPDDEAELPPWAGPSVYPQRPRGTRVRPPVPEIDERDYRDSGDYRDDGLAGDRPDRVGGGRRSARRPGGRAALARLRRSRRRVYIWCGTAIVACVVAAGIAALVIPGGGAKALPYVTKLLPGEYKSAPDACKAVDASLLSSIAQGAKWKTTQQMSGASESQCSSTLDHRPDFLVLEVTAQAFQPFAAASGNGSASQNALDNYEAARSTLLNPAKKSPLPAAVITTVAKTGQHAFSAFQREKVSGVVTDLVTVSVLQRNVLITVQLQAQESGEGFGPVPAGDLQAGALKAADSVLALARTQPTA